MKKLSFFFLAACFLSLGLSKCKRLPVFDMPTDDPTSQLPPETQTGANTFGCLVDGKPYNVFGFFPSPPAISISYQFNDLTIKGNQGNQAGIALLGASIDTIGIYKILREEKRPGSTALYRIGSKFYDSISGELHIKKIDHGNRIISGTFHFVGVDSPGDTARITHGRFDVKFN